VWRGASSPTQARGRRGRLKKQAQRGGGEHEPEQALHPKPPAPAREALPGGRDGGGEMIVEEGAVAERKLEHHDDGGEDEDERGLRIERADGRPESGPLGARQVHWANGSARRGCASALYGLDHRGSQVRAHRPLRRQLELRFDWFPRSTFSGKEGGYDYGQSETGAYEDIGRTGSCRRAATEEEHVLTSEPSLIDSRSDDLGSITTRGLLRRLMGVRSQGDPASQMRPVRLHTLTPPRGEKRTYI